MKLLHGLTNSQVLQRNKQNVSETILEGKSSVKGTLKVRVTKNNRLVPGFNWKTVATLNKGNFQVKLTGIPVGGPYQISIGLEKEKGKMESVETFSDILVGDVWILAGQSNMEGIGLLKDALKPNPQVRAFYMDDRWATAKDPIHNLYQAVDEVHGKAERPKHVGVGPGVGFGQRMHELSGVPQGLISCAHGGTSMDQWNPSLKKMKGKSFYGAMIRRFHKNGGKVAGVVWYQGESDATPEAYKDYTPKMKKLVASIRRDFDDKNLPFIMVQIASVHRETSETAKYWNSIQDQELKLMDKIDRLITVPAIDLSLDDAIHLSGVDQARLGRRLADGGWALLHGKKAGTLPIKLKSITTKPNRLSGNMDIEVTFDNVSGSLQSAGKPSGFALVNDNYTKQDVIYRTELLKNKVILRTSLMSAFFSGSGLSYGFGLAPYCNITDENDQSLPVFGPHWLEGEHAPEQFIQDFRVSRVFPGNIDIRKLTIPSLRSKSLVWTPMSFPGPFASRREELQKLTDDGLVYYHCKFSCKEPMSLEIGLGYDGPVKMWINGKEKFCDPSGTNPARPDEKNKVTINTQRGQTEIIVALGANFGHACGIFLSVRRIDVPKRLIKLGPEHYAIPEINVK